MKKLPLLLFVFLLYFLLILMFFLSVFDFLQYVALFTAVFIVVLYAFNVLFALIAKVKARELLAVSLLSKLLLIPMFALNFLIGMLLTVSIHLMGAVPIIIISDFLLLLVTSVYGVRGTVKAYKAGIISSMGMIANVLLHFVFCADILSTAYVYIRCIAAEKRTPVNAVK